MLDRHSRIQAVNPAYLELVGLTPEEAVGQLCPELHRCQSCGLMGDALVDWVRGGLEPGPLGEPEDACQHCPMRGATERQSRLVWLQVKEHPPRIVLRTYSFTGKGRSRKLLIFFQPVEPLHGVVARCQNELCKLGHELQLAAGLEENVVPHRHDCPADLEIGLASLPLRQVGGDVAESFFVNKNWRAYVADLSGKSLPAALLMREIRALCYQELRTELPIALSHLNRRLCAFLPSAMFLALTAVGWDGQTLRLVNAGNELPWLLREGLARPLEACQGLVLGVDSQACWRACDVRLEAGELLAILTDGALEALHRSGQKLGAWLEELSRLPGRAFQARVQACLREWPREDDATVMVLRRRASG